MPSARGKRARPSEENDAAAGDKLNGSKQRPDTATIHPTAARSPPSIPLDNSSDTHLQRLQAVFDWAAQHGASAPKLRLAHGDYGWGVFATADIAPQEELASIPLTLVLTHQRADDSPVGSAVRELNDRVQSSADLPHPAVLISPRTTLYLYMIQQLTDPTAFFHTYLTSLTPPCSPLHWPPTSLSHLQGTNLYAAIPNKLRQLRSRYDNSVPLLCRLHPTQFSASVFTFDRFLWAHTQLTSRGFPVRVGQRSAEERVTAGELRAEGSKRPNERVGCLLPLLDMTNHRMRTSITWTTTSSTEARVAFRVGDSSSSGVAVSAGSEVFNNYGAKSNEEFLLGYGFCMDDNPYDEYTVQLGGVNGDTAYMLDRLQLTWRDKGYYLMVDSTPQQLVAVLRVAVMTEGEREVHAWQCVEQGNVQSVQYVSLRNEVAMLDQLHQLLMSRLAKLGHDTVDEAEVAEQLDKQRLGQADVAEDERLAVVYRKGQRHILTQRIRHTQQTKANILASTSSHKLYRLSPPIAEADRRELKQLSTAWERVLNPEPLASTSDVSVPSSLLITPSTIRESETFAPVLEYAAGLTSHQELTLFILHHLQLATASPYSTLLAYLHHPSHLSHQFPASVASSAEYSDAVNVYEQLFPALTEADAELFTAAVHSRDNWLWAHYLVHRHTLLLPPTADTTQQLTFLPLTTLPPTDTVWRGQPTPHTNLSLTLPADTRITYPSDADNDSHSVWTRGECLVNSASIVRVTASVLFSVSYIESLSSAHRALFPLFQSWEDEHAESGYFYVGLSGVSGGLVAWCRLLAMTAEEIAMLMQHIHALSQTTPLTAAGGAVVLDTDERCDDEAVAVETAAQQDGENDEDGAGEAEIEANDAELEDDEPGGAEREQEQAEVSGDEEDEDEETEQAAQEQSAQPSRNLKRLLLAGPHEFPELLDWQRIRAGGWQHLHTTLAACVKEQTADVEQLQGDTGEEVVNGVVEVSWERLQCIHRHDRLRVLRASVKWVEQKVHAN